MGQSALLPLDPRSIRALKAHLTLCLYDHECGGPTDAPPPTRLLDLDGPDADHIKLVESASAGIKNGRYAALSYTWGQCNTFIATPATLGERLQGFRLEELPQTLRDAVKAARYLGCRYLWIDALCILQGPTPEAQADWERESARMEATYSNAVVTIVAAGAKHSNSGLHGRARPRAAAGGPDDPDKWWFKDEPINSRAWALQEWVLSSRVATFTSRGAYFHCERSGIPSDLAYRSFYNFQLPRSPAEVRPGVWGFIVRNYTSRSLSNPSDKLPALAGLARRFDRLSGGAAGRYLAGLWEATLPADLEWRRDNGFRAFLAQPREQEDAVAAGAAEAGRRYRAPSWSWAAVDGIVVTTRHEVGTAPAAEVLACETHLATADPYSAVAGGRLVVRGPARTADALDVRGPGYPRLRGGGADLARVWLDDDDDDALADAAGGRGFHCLVMQAAQDRCRGIVLVWAGEEGDGELYRRIGYFVCANLDEDERFRGASRREFTVV